jgi:hypothetical protein
VPVTGEVIEKSAADVGRSLSHGRLRELL